MSIGVIATITIQEGKNAEFEEAFAVLAEQVRANEPGNIFYALHRSQSNPCIYKVLEQYASQADLDAHNQTDYFKAANEVLFPLVAAIPDIELLDGV